MSKALTIGVIIPDRNDRPLFLKNCLRMLRAQTITPDFIEVVNDKPLSDKPDITWRYRLGYDRLRNKNIDCILFIENDDWYSPTYIETMIQEWSRRERPNLLGHSYTIYYHIKLFAFFSMLHQTRASAMNTLIAPDMYFEWCRDDDPFTDTYLWQTINSREIFTPANTICLGIKHGVGLCGGQSHVNRLNRYTDKGTDDKDQTFLKSIMDSDSFNFYANYFNNANT